MKYVGFLILLSTQIVATFFSNPCPEGRLASCCPTIAHCQKTTTPSGTIIYDFIADFSEKNITTLIPFPAYCGYDSYATCNGSKKAAGNLTPDKITIIDLSFNLLTTIPSYVFEPFTHVKELTISHNNISWIEKSAFEGLKNLNLLDLSYNKLTVITPEMLILDNATTCTPDVTPNSLISYCSSTTLKTLILKENLIQEVKDGSFYQFSNLNTLDMQRNKLTAIPDLNGLTSLTKLILDKNSISLFQDDQFSKIPLLKYLSIADNLLNDFSNLFELTNLNYLIVLDLRGNPISDTAISDLRAALPNTQILF